MLIMLSRSCYRLSVCCFFCVRLAFQWTKSHTHTILCSAICFQELFRCNLNSWLWLWLWHAIEIEMQSKRKRENEKDSDTTRALKFIFGVILSVLVCARGIHLLLLLGLWLCQLIEHQQDTHTHIHTRSLSHINGRILKYLSALWWVLMRVSTDIPLLFAFCVDPLLFTFI